jgi:hypothetical protein
MVKRSYNQWAVKSGNIASALTERLRDLTQEAEGRVRAVEARVRKPKRRGRAGKAIGLTIAFLSASAVVPYVLKLKSRFVGGHSTSDDVRPLAGQIPVQETMSGAQPAASEDTPSSSPSTAFESLMGKDDVEASGKRDR